MHVGLIIVMVYLTMFCDSVYVAVASAVLKCVFIGKSDLHPMYNHYYNGWKSIAQMFMTLYVLLAGPFAHGVVSGKHVRIPTLFTSNFLEWMGT